MSINGKMSLIKKNVIKYDLIIIWEAKINLVGTIVVVYIICSSEILERYLEMMPY